MKTGNKRVIALLCAVLILLNLIGCKVETEEVQKLKNEVEELKKEIEELKTETEETAAPEKENSVQYIDFYLEFRSRLEEVEDVYELIKLEPVELNDLGGTVQPFTIKETLLGQSYRISVAYNTEGEVLMVDLTADTTGITDYNFALLSIYAYESLGLPEMEDFYEQFNLMTEKPDGILQPAPGWYASAITTDDFIMFMVNC